MRRRREWSSLEIQKNDIKTIRAEKWIKPIDFWWPQLLERDKQPLCFCFSSFEESADCPGSQTRMEREIAKEVFFSFSFGAFLLLLRMAKDLESLQSSAKWAALDRSTDSSSLRAALSISASLSGFFFFFFFLSLTFCVVEQQPSSGRGGPR